MMTSKIKPKENKHIINKTKQNKTKYIKILQEIGCGNSKKTINTIRQRIIDAAAYVIIKQPRRVKKTQKER